MKRIAVVAVLSLLAAACNATGPEVEHHPGEDTAGVGMRLRLVPQLAEQGAVKAAALTVAQQENPPGTYLCVCPPPVPGDTSQTRTCTCQVEGGPEVPDACGDGILNEATENCDPGLGSGSGGCPGGTHCNRGEEVADDGVAYPACFNCIRDS